jgi:hypothetical protein
MIPLTPAQQAALTAPTVPFARVVEWVTSAGIYRWATEGFWWGGVWWDGRLLEEPTITLDLGDPGAGLAGPAALTVQLNNADGWVSRQDPRLFRGGTVWVREIVRSVGSPALRSFRFVGTALRMTSPVAVELEAEMPLAPLLSRPVPSPNLTVDTVHLPYAQPAAAQALPYPPGAQAFMATGQTLPLAVGWVRAPLTFFRDEQSWHTFLAPYGGARTLVGTVYQLVNSRWSLVASGVTLGTLPAPFGRLQTVQIPITTAVAVGGGTPVPHFADCISAPWSTEVSTVFGAGRSASPAGTLLWLLTDSVAGLGVASELIAWDSFRSAQALTAQSFTLYGFDAALGPTTAGELFGAWAHDALSYLVFTDQLRVIPAALDTGRPLLEQSMVVVGTARLTVRPLDQEESARTVEFPDRTRGGAVLRQQWRAGSGEVTRTLRFIGRPSAAWWCAQWWARAAAAGAVEYSFDTAPGAALDLDVGDQVFLSHPDIAPGIASPLALITGYTRGPGGQLTLRLRQLPYPNLNAQGVPPSDPPFQADEQIVPLPYNVSTIPPNAQVQVTFNHTLGRPPTVAVPLPPLPSGVTLALSVAPEATNATQVTVYAKAGPVAVPYGGASTGWQFTDLLVI